MRIAQKDIFFRQKEILDYILTAETKSCPPNLIFLSPLSDVMCSRWRNRAISSDIGAASF